MLNIFVFIEYCRKLLLLQSAKELCCGKIFTAGTSSDLAIQILTDVSLGRGSQMHHDVVLVLLCVLLPLLFFSIPIPL